LVLRARTGGWLAVIERAASPSEKTARASIVPHARQEVKRPGENNLLKSSRSVARADRPACAGATRYDSALVAWDPSLYAPRTRGVHDSHHRTAGIAGRARRRGGRVALGCRPRATARKNAAHRRAPERRRGRSGLSGLGRGVPAGACASGLDHRAQRAHRHALGRRQTRRRSQIRGGIGRAGARRHPGPWHLNRATVAAGDPHRADRVPDRRRSGGRWVCRQPGAARRQRHRELAGMTPDLILASSSANLTALLRTTRTIPIVFVQVSDPVAQGFVSNLAHPGGNITGFSAFEPTMAGKWLDLLKQAAPGLARVAVIFNPDTSPQSKLFVPAIEASASSLAVEVVAAPVHVTGEFEPLIANPAHRPNSGLIFPTDQFLTSQRGLILELVARHHLPAVYASETFARNGGLIYYGTDWQNQFRQAAIYVDRILKGSYAGELPVQQPTKFPLIVNLASARGLGIELPTALLLSADEVIE